MGHLFQMLKAGLACYSALTRKHQIPSNPVAINGNQRNSAPCGARSLMAGLGKDIGVAKLHILILNTYVLCFESILYGLI